MSSNSSRHLQAALSEIKWNESGLVPAIIQDASSKEVLMMAYMNQDSLTKSAESGETWFWSRSRGELWHKGATSGHTQHIVSMHYDCDGDTLLIQVRQTGAACHTGEYSCFHNEIEGSLDVLAADDRRGSTISSNDRFAMLNRLETIIAQRYAERPEGAYTTYLFEKGIDKILKKVGEESAEVIIAAKNRDNDELRCEASDLIFHLMVLFREQGLSLDEVMAELDYRHNKSK